MNQPKIMVIGDIHGRWDLLNHVIEHSEPDRIFQCGDFGFWPKSSSWFSTNKIKNNRTKIYFCDGNHDDHDSLNTLENNEIAKNIFYMKRGSTLCLPDGRNVLFIGGADSIDKHRRTIGIDWFPQEVLSESDFETLPDSEINIIISHTCPREVLPNLHGVYGTSKYDLSSSVNCSDPSCDILSKVLEKYKPELWFFAHWHEFTEGQIKETKWTTLKNIEMWRDSFKWLPEA